MIGKILLIRDSGLLPFYMSQDVIKIDHELLSGFCMANYSIAQELSDSIDIILMKNNHKIIFEELKASDGKTFIVAAFCNQYHINEGVKSKIRHVFNRFFKNYKFESEHVCISDENIKENVKCAINDIPLANLVNEHIDFIKSRMDPILNDTNNCIHSYAICSSNNNILYCKGKPSMTQNHPDGTSVEDIIQEYLGIWKIEDIPQGDLFSGLGMLTGLDLNDFVHTNEKTYGLCINSSINLAEEPENELLIYFFGKNTLMRQCAMDIEEVLREYILEDKKDWFNL